MSSVTNEAASINAPAVNSAGGITPPTNPDPASFMASRLPRSTHPALNAGSAGGQVAHPAQRIIDAAGGQLDRH